MPTTTYLELDDQATGANNNTWGDVSDANMAIIEQAIARFLSLATTGGTTTLTSSQNRFPIIRLTGVLVSNATIQVRTAEKNWIFINATTGAFTVTVKTLAGTGKTLPRGRAVSLYCDGTNVEQARWPGLMTAQAGGTVDALTATFEPAVPSGDLQDGTLFLVEAAGANATTTPSFQPDANTARTITKNGGQALGVGDIRGAGHKLLLCYDETSTRYELLNPMNYPLASNAEVQTGTEAAKIVTPAGLTAKEATAAQYRANTADRILTTDEVWNAAGRVALTWTSGGNTAVDLSTGLNFTVTAATGNSTLGAPTNAKTGQSGFIEITQDGVTPRTLAFNAAWQFDGGVDPVLTAVAGAKDVLYYTVLNSVGPVLHATLRKAVA